MVASRKQGVKSLLPVGDRGPHPTRTRKSVYVMGRRDNIKTRNRYQPSGSPQKAPPIYHQTPDSSNNKKSLSRRTRGLLIVLKEIASSNVWRFGEKAALSKVGVESNSLTERRKDEEGARGTTNTQRQR